ncbi:MAG: hypothetical protein JW923_11515 [Spirochaetales bacterium]|nr:hypothetical protein [Spirochaetales bacterium]
MKKNLFFGVLALIGLALAGCSASPVVDLEQAAVQLEPLGSMVSVARAAGHVVDASGYEASSKAVNPGDAYFDSTEINDRTPAQVWALRTDGTVRRYPTAGYYEDYYNVGEEAYFTLEVATDSLGAPISGWYLVKVYVYPRYSLLVSYVYEEYYVQADDATWAYYSDTSSSPGYALLQTYMKSGQVFTKTVNATGVASYTGTDAFSLDPLVDPPAYAYSATPGAPGTDTGLFYVDAYSVTPNGRAYVREFYSETDSVVPGQPDSSGVMYVYDRYLGNKEKTEVTRYKKLGDERTIRSFYTDDRHKSGLYTGVVATNIDTVSGAPIVIEEFSDYWPGTSGQSYDTASGTYIKLTETSVGSNAYSGTLVDYWPGGAYVYSADISADGTASYSGGVYDGAWTRTGVAGWPDTFNARSLSPRAALADQSLDLAALGGFSLVLPSGARFHGAFEGGVFSGTFTDLNGATATVVVDSFGVAVGDDFQPWPRLQEALLP